MARYRSKPVAVDAVVWDGTNDSDVEDFLNAVVYSSTAGDGTAVATDMAGPRKPTWFAWGDDGAGRVLRFYVEKGQSQCTIHVGDAVIAERDGSGYYPCAADEFAQRYVRVVDNEADGS